MNKNQARIIDSQIKKALEATMKTNNLILIKSGGRFGLDTLKLTFEFKELQKNEKPQDALKRDFDRQAGMFNLQNCFKKQFMSNGKIYNILGINSKRPKYPVIAERNSDGRKFKFSADTVRRELNLFTERK